MIQNGNLNFLQLTFFKKMEVTFTQAGRYVHWLHERKQHVSWWCDANEKACAQAIFLLQWRCQALVPQHVRIASFTFFIASLLLYWLYWRMNPWTRACPSVSLLFKVTFDHPTLKLWDLKWGGRRKCMLHFATPPPICFLVPLHAYCLSHSWECYDFYIYILPYNAKSWGGDRRWR